MKTLKTWAAAVGLIALSGAAQAALTDRGGGMIYDTTLNITWLADWNYANTSGFANGGLMNWTTANNWANNLVYGGYHDWRLPTSLDAGGTGPCGPGAINCSGSEMGHMFYNNWGAPAGHHFSLGTNTANLALFSNVLSSAYWSGTEYAPVPSFAWFFYTAYGVQDISYKSDALYAVAVRPGDVAAPVPEPQTLALWLLALGATVVSRRRRPA